MAELFRYLFSPLTMRGVTIPNRLGNAPHGTRMLRPESLTECYSDAMPYYVAERAKGGAGLIILGCNSVHATGRCAPGASIVDDVAMPVYRQITELVHRHPTKIFSQLLHRGRQGSGWFSHRPLWAPSPVVDPTSREVPHEMDGDEIDEVVAAFGIGAVRSLEGGFDGIELHGAHGYLLGSFMSRFSNFRTDEYGGTLENRLRLTVRVIEAVRRAIGETVPLGIRLSADEFVPEGLTLEETSEIARLLSATRQIDYVSVSQGCYPSAHVTVPEMTFPSACFAHLPAGIRAAVDDVPVMAVARINDPIIAERMLAEGQADFILMVRGLIADPELPVKAREGRLDEIRTCMGCNVGCRGGPNRKLPIACVQNPAVAIERLYGIGTRQPAAIRKKVVVIGGGPAGLKAAEEAAERGHWVTLFEKSDQLGGQVLIAAKAPYRDEFGGSVRFLAKQLKRLGVTVHLGTAASAEMVAALDPDAVVVATGSSPDLPHLPGIEQENVFNVHQVIRDEVPLGKTVAVVDGGEADWKLCCVADFIAQHDKRVEVITALPVVGMDIDGITRQPIVQRLKSKDVRFHVNTAVHAIKGNTLVLADLLNGGEWELTGVDAFVFAHYNKADDGLYRALKGRVRELHAAGDCVAPRKAIDAIREGFLVGREL